ncbi:MAG: FtsX-like permease family protein [Alphaproteobacteria bacterium]
MARTRFDLPFAQDESRRFVPVIFALMVFLAALSLGGILVLQRTTERWSAGFSSALTIQVSPGDNAKPADLDEQVRKVLALLRQTPGIAMAEALDTDAIVRLLEPWLGSGPLVRELPLPRLIDVAIAPDAKLDTVSLARQIMDVAPGATVDDHRTWLRNLRNLARSIELISMGIIVFVAFVGIGVIVFVTRTGLLLHRDVVDVLHLVGARDSYVARQFERHVLMMSLKGGLAGLALAAGAMIGLDQVGQRLAPSLLPSLSLAPEQWLALAAVPVIATLITMLTARVTVLRTLARQP